MNKHNNRKEIRQFWGIKVGKIILRGANRKFQRQEKLYSIKSLSPTEASKILAIYHRTDKIAKTK